MSRTDWEVVIGLEVHTQLSTQSKIFSGASIAFGAEPNVQACAVDIALPGVLPVLNKGAVERAIRFGLAVGATIAPKSVFARKNYFYPDLPKGYQISQYELPVVQGGHLDIMVGDVKHTVRLIADLLRSVDALGRFGGEEFMVLMPNTELKGAADAANRMRMALTRTKLEIQGKVVPLSASFGAAALGRNEKLDDLVRRADAAMYEAKRLGRNRVEVDDSVVV